MNGSPDFILIVEDDPNLLITIQMILEDSDYSVMTATNGLEALEVIRQYGLPRLILLDMKMPVMNGWEFARKFYADFGNSTPIVVLTAAEDARKRAEEVNANDHLGKPFEIEDLLMLLKKHLGSTQRAGKAI